MERAAIFGSHDTRHDNFAGVREFLPIVEIEGEEYIKAHIVPSL